MKVFISADIEGVTGVTVWDEADQQKAEYSAAREQMTAEVTAACEGALQAGATEILIKDSHDTGRNLIAAKLPEEARLIRGWSGHPFMMLQNLDDTFQAVLLIGYHSGASFGSSPLEHTLSGSVVSMKLNGQDASEFLIDAYTAAFVKVPLIFVSGDKGLCDEVGRVNPHIGTVAVKEGVGNSTINIHPGLAVARIRAGVTQAPHSQLDQCRLPLPDHFSLEVRYRSHTRANDFSFFPGVRLKDSYTVQLETESYFEVLRYLVFAV